MIPSLKEEISIIFYLTCYGVFIIAIYDLFLFVINPLKWKRIFKIGFEIIFWLSLILLTYIFSYRLHNGYIPLYFGFFLLIGVLLYLKWFKKPMIEGALMIKKLVIILLKPLKKIFLFLFYNRETWKIIKYPLKKMILTVKLMIKKFKKEQNNNKETPA